MIRLIPVFALCLCCAVTAPANDESQDARIAELIARITQDKSDYNAERELERIGEPATAALVAAIEFDNGRGWFAASVLSRTKAASSLPAMLKVARRPGPNQKNAVRVLCALGGEEACPVLIAELRDPKCRFTEVIPALAAIGDRRAVPILINIMQDKEAHDRNWRRAAASALAKFRGPDVRAALQATVKDETDRDVYRSARRSLLADRGEIDSRWPNLMWRAFAAIPEPAEGAEEAIRKCQEDEKDGRIHQVGCPNLTDFLSPLDIERARNELVRIGQAEYGAELVEQLIDRTFGNRRTGGVAETMDVIVRIGPNAVGPLKSGIERGDKFVQRQCGQCLARIDSAKKP